jgi:hypothetical protein
LESLVVFKVLRLVVYHPRRLLILLVGPRFSKRRKRGNLCSRLRRWVGLGKLAKCRWRDGQWSDDRGRWRRSSKSWTLVKRSCSRRKRRRPNKAWSKILKWLRSLSSGGDRRSWMRLRSTLERRSLSRFLLRSRRSRCHYSQRLMWRKSRWLKMERSTLW